MTATFVFFFVILCFGSGALWSDFQGVKSPQPTETEIASEPETLLDEAKKVFTATADDVEDVSLSIEEKGLELIAKIDNHTTVFRSQLQNGIEKVTKQVFKLCHQFDPKSFHNCGINDEMKKVVFAAISSIKYCGYDRSIIQVEYSARINDIYYDAMDKLSRIIETTQYCSANGKFADTVVVDCVKQAMVDVKTTSTEAMKQFNDTITNLSDTMEYVESDFIAKCNSTKKVTKFYDLSSHMMKQIRERIHLKFYRIFF